jgi:formate dehydrogenase alpha subunit
MMDRITFTIDGIKIEANKGDTILKTALEQGIYIPHLCHHPDLEPVGVCRLCMVDIDGRGMTISCKTPVEEGMVVRTETPEINKTRKIAVELLIVNHHADCLSCGKNTECKLQEVANYIGIEEERLKCLRRPDRTLPIDTSNPFFDRDPNRCVLCGICVRTCEEIQGVSAIDFAFRGFATTVSTFGDHPLIESRCESCGECVVRCPVGALIQKKREKPARKIKTICPYCGCGCGIYLGVRGNKVVSVEGDRGSVVNEGRLCVKGRFGYDFIHHPERLTSPLIKKDGGFVEVSWDEALEFVAKRLSEYKGDQFALIASAKCTNEENYLAQKFARAVMGTNNVDHCARLCHAPTVMGLIQAIGRGAMCNPISDIKGTSCIFAIGTNTTETHPIIGLAMKEAVKNGTKLIVANPQRIDLCRFATVFLQHRCGTDVALVMGMCRVIVDEGLEDSSFIMERCEGFENFRKSLADFDLDTVERITGVSREKIREAARIFATCKPQATFWSMGITQHSHGTDNVLALANLVLLTGAIGKPSTGVNPLRGQNNVQGACDMGTLTTVYPGYQKVADEKVREKFEKAWGIKLSPNPGITMSEVWAAVSSGKIKALYIIGAEPMLGVADRGQVERGLMDAEFVVVQDIFLNETAKLADVVLPASCFAEKEGTFTNTERRVQRIHKAVEPPGQAREDWWIICELAKRMGVGGFEFSSAEEIMGEIASLTPIYGGISWKRLEMESLQWPCPDKEHPGTPILHCERFNTPNGKGRFTALQYKPPAELPDEEYPFTLTTQRLLGHFHGVISRRVSGLNLIRGEELVEVNPEDASRLNIRDGEEVLVVSRRGEIKARVKITDDTPPGALSMDFHFAEAPTNIITNPALDPLAKTPETKVCAVRVEKIEKERN